MPLPTAREIEQHYFEQFRRHFPVPDGQVIYADKPDVRVHGDRILGVELVRLYLKDGRNQESEQRQAALRSQVLAKAQALHFDRGGRNIELHVDFDPAAPIIDVLDAANRLANLVQQIQHQPTTLSGNAPQVEHGLRFVYHNAIAYQDSKWRNTQSYSVGRVDPERLRDVVEEKVIKAKQYEACDELWLLVVVDFMDRAQDQDLTLPDGLRLDAKPFDRILLYKPQFSQVVEVAR